MTTSTIPQPPQLSELFSRDPLQITDAEFEEHILPYYRARRVEVVSAKQAGDKVPRGKKVALDPNVTIEDLGL